MSIGTWRGISSVDRWTSVHHLWIVGHQYIICGSSDISTSVVDHVVLKLRIAANRLPLEVGPVTAVTKIKIDPSPRCVSESGLSLSL
ncbi:hypothetical protein DPMN_082571 [Dreissena polymorpha]|uniref:Uncharacterized protein n=1 Tax=Dreissena polymorpha TaxID=45954 RepID=A0A9D3YB32_DREPO|nr:hypothetical protein DPMN_082571 [Dreissena polymorpha]